jgi:predicted aldo/keto reductase-like oxidoreductase
MSARDIYDAIDTAAGYHEGSAEILRSGVGNATKRQIHIALRVALSLAVDQGIGSDVARIRKGLKALGVEAIDIPGLPGVKT